MKVRSSFVANSSSSSFILVTAGDMTLISRGEECEGDNTSVDIDALIADLQTAKANGATRVEFEYGGEYNG